MAREKDLLLTFLNTFPNQTIQKAIADFPAEKPGIKIKDILGKRYTLWIFREENANQYYEVIVSVQNEEVKYRCTCGGQLKVGACIHGALSAIYILVRAFGFTHGQVKKHFGIKDMEPNEAEAARDEINSSSSAAQKPTTVSKTSKPVEISKPAVVNVMPASNEWKTFNAKPHLVFQSVPLIFFGSPSSVIVKNTIITHILREEVTVKFECRPAPGSVFYPEVKFDRDETFSYRCFCGEQSKMCYHVKAGFEILLKEKGKLFFEEFKNWDEAKNKMLKPYGIKIEDKEAADFKFSVDAYGSLHMLPPSWLWKADISDNVKGLKHALVVPATNPSRPTLPAGTIQDFEIGFLVNLDSDFLQIGFELELIKLQALGKKQKMTKISLNQPATLSMLGELPDELYNQLMRISNDGIRKKLMELGFSGRFLQTASWDQLDTQGKRTLKQYYIVELQKIWPMLCVRNNLFILKQGNFVNSNVNPATLSPVPVKFGFTVEEDNRYLTINRILTLDGEAVDNNLVQSYHGFLFEISGVLHLTADAADSELISQFSHGFIKVPIGGKGQVIKSVIPMLQKKFNVETPPSLTAQKVQADPKPQVLLKEIDGKFLVLQPQYQYQGFTVNYETNPDNLFITLPDHTCIIVERNPEMEKEFYYLVRSLHPKFEKPTQNDFFFLSFDETMRQNWFLETMSYLVEQNIPVLGIQDLKRHHYNPNKPKWEMRASNSTDWFDVHVRVSFGDQTVELKEVRKAMQNKRNVVVLDDGTFGMLPDEWLSQYSMLLKMGEEQKNGKLRVSKMHYTIIDELSAQINNEEVLEEINLKKERLKNIGDIKEVQPGTTVNAKLRPYQLSGFQWMHGLDEMGWGGCLADDMGLGKTLQAITFLDYLKTKYPGSTHLVICPTSLIYNWESELQKFAPALNYHVYYGAEREFTDAHFNDYDVVISSYGVIRIDLAQLMQFDWHYIILDESQAIKNPEAQINKALHALKSKNRIILSGTPIQNNTYDLYAQFNFINPGLLGKKDFFKTEFANPIDKNNDTEKSAQLRRLIFPFMMRRTKQQVASDLPDKTETVLWCEMGKEQRQAYESYKEYYRIMLLDKIEKVGMAKAGMFVIEGLLRLRQICDSPVLVKDAEITTRKSIKIDELMREIEENAGGHKLLVFSQFTEMLHLIAAELDAQQIEYAYLDGTTAGEKRKEAVKEFQGNEKLRVFLISLKAGGVGLNLTAADYVYIVDPWWNPAVEQQAIDRTHRIGQVNKIFAYKMICKGTVEEKIIQLQQRKKQIADDLVTEDAGFIKKLTRDDVAFLFS